MNMEPFRGCVRSWMDGVTDGQSHVTHRSPVGITCRDPEKWWISLLMPVGIPRGDPCPGRWAVLGRERLWDDGRPIVQLESPSMNMQDLGIKAETSSSMLLALDEGNLQKGKRGVVLAGAD